MRIRIAVLVGVALMVGATSWSQENRLGDVAGSIKLNPEAIVESSGFVDDPRAAKKADEDLFDVVLAECSAGAEQLGRLVAEARLTVIYPGDDLLTRLGESSLELERQVDEIFLLRLAPAYSEPIETARDAAVVCAAGSITVRREIELGSVAFTKSGQEVSRCRQRLGEAQAQFAAVAAPAGSKGGRPAAANAAPAIPKTPPTDDEIIEAVCRPELSNGPDAFEACQGLQYRSLAALESRSAENEMMVEAVFADIRAICGELHPLDFVARNTCEQDKMTAARLELE